MRATPGAHAGAARAHRAAGRRRPPPGHGAGRREARGAHQGAHGARQGGLAAGGAQGARPPGSGSPGPQDARARGRVGEKRGARREGEGKGERKGEGGEKSSPWGPNPEITISKT
jgi:hypothetical protein